MINDSERLKKRRKKLAKAFSEDWELELNDIPKIRYKKIAGVKGLYKKIRRKKHTVFAMYWFFNYEYVRNEHLQKFHFPINHDNTPVKGVPMKYTLQGRWIIDDEDLSYLRAGPLLDQDYMEIVKPEPQNGKRKTTVRK